MFQAEKKALIGKVKNGKTRRAYITWEGNDDSSSSSTSREKE